MEMKSAGELAEEWEEWGEEFEDEEFAPFTIWTQNNLVVIFIGMALAIDYTVVLVSLPNYWTNVAPSKTSLLGLVVGMYDLSQMLFAPIFGWLSDRHGIKNSFIIALVINIVGGVLYSLGIVIGGYHGVDKLMQPIWGQWWLLIAGRFVAGIGSAALGLSAIYFTRTTSVADRQRAMAAQQAPLVFARAVGPTLGTVLVIFLPQHLENNDKLQQVFNFLTLPGWLCVAISTCALLCTICFFKEPLVFQKQNKKDLKEAQRRREPFDFHKAERLLHLVCTVCPVYLLMTVVRMGLIGAMVYLAVGQYHLVTSSQLLWLPWMGVLGGSIVGLQLLRLCVERGVSDLRMAIHSQWPLVLGIVLLLDLQRMPLPGHSHAHGQNATGTGMGMGMGTGTGMGTGMGAVVGNSSSSGGGSGDGGSSGTSNSVPMFFAGSALVAISNMLYSPSQESVYTKAISGLEAEAQGRIGFFTALFTATGALSRFLGPFIGVYILTVQPSVDATRYLSACRSAPPPNLLDMSQPAVQTWMQDCVLDYPRAFGNTGGDYLSGLPHSEPCAGAGMGMSVNATCDYCPTVRCCEQLGAAFKAGNMSEVEQLLARHCCDPSTHCLNLDSFCYPFVFPQHFFNRGCKVENVNLFMPVIAALTAATAIAMHCFRIGDQKRRRVDNSDAGQLLLNVADEEEEEAP